MLRSLHTITIISDYLRNKNKLKTEASSIDDIYNFFIYLQCNKNKFYTLYIYNYLFNFISSNEVAKRKTSARVFEDLLAIMCNAKVADDSIRQNIIYAVPNLKDSVMDLVNQFDYKLHKSYVDYFANQNSKRDILADLENLFKYFDKNFKELV